MLESLLASPQVARVVAPTRRPLGVEHPRLLHPLPPMKWRPNRAERIADALVDAVLQAPPGRHRVDANRLA